MTSPGDDWTQSIIAHAAGADASVNAPAFTALFHPDGREIIARDDQVEQWLTQGFSRLRFDTATLTEELPLLFDQAKQSVATLLAELDSKTELETHTESALFVASAAMEHLVQHYAQVLRAVHARLPIQQAPAVTVDHPEQGTVTVDPTIAAHMVEHEGATVSAAPASAPEEVPA